MVAFRYEQVTFGVLLETELESNCSHFISARYLELQPAIIAFRQTSWRSSGTSIVMNGVLMWNMMFQNFLCIATLNIGHIHTIK